MSEAAAARPAALNDAIMMLQARFRTSLEERIIRMETAAAALDAAPDDDEARQAVHRDCHKLAGIASSLGFEGISEKAAEIDGALSAGKTEWKDLREKVEDLLDEMEQELD